MTDLRADPDGRVHVSTPRYRLEVTANGLRATLSSPTGEHWASLRPLAALDRADGPDETLAVAPPRVADAPGVAIDVVRRSTRWEHAAVRLVCTDDAVEVRTAVRGRGALTDVHLLACRSLLPGAPTGFLPSGSSFRTLFTANPDDPGRLVRPAGEPAVIGVSGDDHPGRGHWFFTPAPLYFALTTAGGVEDPAEHVADGWLGVGVAAPVDELQFVQLAYEPADRAFSLRLDYEGHTLVDGEFSAPSVVLTPGEADPYTGIGRHRDALVARGAAPERAAEGRPAWWSRPIFCGWGAQCHLAVDSGRPARDFAAQAHYDAFLAELEAHDLVPGTVVVDDKWQEAYGTCVPDRDKWPDLAGWIGARHARGQRVLLWWKAWDPEGLAPELAIRNPDGVAVAVDPTNPAAEKALREAVARMLSPDALGADGLKIDFTARTPSGTALATHGPGWGIALLHRLLAIVYRAAKDAKPDALVITHTPHPAFVDVTDMVRLNDMLRLLDLGPTPPIVPQMRHRARIAHAACPGLLVDTDDWCVPDLASWRAYLEVKPELGVPALYYTTHLDLTAESLTLADYETLRRTWATWEAPRSTTRR